MHRQTQRFLVQSFSLLNALFLAFQPVLAVPLVLSTPVAVQAETGVDPELVDLSFNQGSHEFELLVKIDRSLPYVLTYVDESQDPVVEQAATGNLEEIEPGVYGDTIYAGTCSGDVCTPHIVNSGVLQIGDQFKMEYRVVNGQVVMGGSSSEATECIAPDAERLNSGETLWTVDEDQQTAETQSAVKPGVVYQFPLDDKVSVTFSCLPKDESARTSLKIQQIATEELALPDTVKIDSKYAYDITTEMANGSFKYELTLPKAEGTEVEVSYIEKTLDEAKQEVKADDVKVVEENEEVKIEQNTEKNDVTVTGLDHFTIFVVVPSDIVTSNLNLVSWFQQGWRMTSTGNASIALVDIASHSIPAGFGPHVIRTDRTGGAGNNRAYLGYYESGLTLNQIESIKWNRYTKTGSDTYLNIYLINPHNLSSTATVVVNPAISPNVWEEEVFNSVTTGITIRQGGTTSNITHAQLMSNYGSWLVRNDTFCKVSGWACLNPANYVQIGGIVFVSGSSNPTAAQEHYYDGITLDFTNQDPIFFNFVKSVPQLATPVNLGWNTRSGSSNPADRPVDVQCGKTTNGDFPMYGNGQVAHNWSTTDTDSQLRFQRQWMWPGSGVWTTDPTIYSATNTPFATFGSSVGTEGTWNTRVRSWLDQNGNAVFDEGTDVASYWSNECAVTYDRTMTSDVTVCKEDEQGKKLAGWSMYLKGATVQAGLSVPTNSSSGVNSSSLEANTSYIAEASGTWTNQGGANIVDAEYSTTDGWATHVDGYTDRQTDILELQINSSFDPNSNWGAYNSAHKYVQSFVPAATGSANFRIFDGTGTTQNESWFGDNNGSLRVDISKGFAGITGENGCTTFNDVPYGNYTVGEIMQDGWEYSGGNQGEVAINQESVTYTLRNKELPINDVTVCKVDQNNVPQPGWTVGLANNTSEFNSEIPVVDGAGVNASLPAGDHVVFASGTYRYGNDAMIADAGFSYRPLSIPLGADGWVNGDQLNTVGGLELKVGGQNIDWGGYNLAHQYTTLVSGFAGGNLNLNIWDDQYSDNLNNGNFRAQVHQVKKTGVTGNNGCVTLEDMPYGDYVAFELPKANWSHVSTMVNSENSSAFPAPIAVNGQDMSVTFKNRLVTGKLKVQKATVPAEDPTQFSVTATGSGQIFGSATGSVTDTSDYTYTLEPQTYSVSEDVPNGWQLTGNNCSNILVPSDGERVCQMSNTKHLNNDSRLYVMKSNDAWPNDKKVGDEVTYTIRVMAVGGPVAGAEVFDLPPLPFSYVPGSYTAESTERGDLKGTITTEPTYASPGVWQLGNLIKDEIVTLTYKAKIGSTDPGIYPDMVWATGTSEQALAQGQAEGDLLAISNSGFNESIGGVNFDGSQGHFGEDNFAGTQVAVIVDQTPSVDHQVAVKVENQGDVLGSSTELPATGGRFWVSLVAMLTVLIGGVMIYLGRKNRSSALAVALMLGLGLIMAPSTQAMTAIRIEQPYNTSAELNQNASTNQRDMKIDFVVMNTAGLSVTAQCQQNKDGGGWGDITTNYVAKAGGNSGYCEVKNLNNQSSYDFRVRVTGDGAGQYSSVVRVGLDTDSPGTPINYGKFKGSDCEDVIKFRTADDNKTVRADVYRSDNAEKFTANKDSRAALINIGPKTDHTLTTSKPDCQKTYFYVVRAFDVNGNGSGLVGDEVLTKVVVEGESGQIQTVTVGAVQVGSSAGGSTVNPLTGQTTGGVAGGVGGVGADTKDDEGTPSAEGEEGVGSTTDETTGENGEETESGSVLGETTGGGFFGWLGSLWQGFWNWLASLFGLN